MLLSGLAGYFNPLIGVDEKETFGKISDMMGFLTAVADHNHLFCDDVTCGVSLVNQMVWTASQYWNSKLKFGEGSAG